MKSDVSAAVQTGEAGEAPELAAPSMAQAATPEARFAGRRSSRTPAYITHTSLSQQVAVTMRDSSSTGARLVLVQTKGAFSPGAERLPSRFILNIPMDRATVECEIAWRRGGLMGVRYVSPTRTMARPRRRLPQQQQQQEAPSKFAKILGFGHMKPL